VDQQPSYILHQRPFRDTSQILDIFSLDYGKLSLVARGSRGSKSRLAGILRPFQPLRLSWSIKTDLGTLTGAELGERPQSLLGDSLMAGYYVNELLLYLLHRHDPQPEVFDAYQQSLSMLAGVEAVAPTLRHFEIELLKLLGYALNVETEAGGDKPLEPDQSYEFRPDSGACPVARDQGPQIYSGRELLAIAVQDFSDAVTLKSASRLLRSVLHYHLDGRELKTRKVLLDLHRGRLPAKQQK
jgi:DNA repair protein RecO (recombination protein O)